MKGLVDKFGKKKLVIAGVLIAIMIDVIISGAIWFWKSNNAGGRAGRDMPQMPGMGEDVIAASGLTSTGMIEEKYELDFLETALFVEEAYLSVGDVVEAGTAVFKVSEETLQEARDELEKAATEADLAYRQGVIDYETQRLEAESTYEQAEKNKEYAQAEYDSALQQAKQEVESLTEQVEEAQELYDEYKAAVESNYYYTYDNVEELKQVYYDNFTYLMKLYEEWNIEELREKYPDSGNSAMSGGMSGSSSAGSNSVITHSGNGSGSAGNSEDFAVMQLNTQLSVGSSDTSIMGYSLQVANDTESSSDSGNSNDSSGGVSDGGESGDTSGEAAGDGGALDGGESEDTSGEAAGDGGASDGGESEDTSGEAAGDGGASDGGESEDTSGEDSGENGAADGEAGGRPGGEMSGASFYNEESSKLSVYEMMDELVQKNGDEYEAVLENYERDTKTATASLESARSDLATLQAELEEAKLEYEKQVIAVKADYETTIAESENAESVFGTEIKKLDEELEALKDEKEESKEKLTLFEDIIGDGYFYTQRGGTVMMNMVRAGNYLSGDNILIAYSNPETVTVQWISAHMERYTLGGNANESHADRGRKKNMGEKEKDDGGICWLA